MEQNKAPRRKAKKGRIYGITLLAVVAVLGVSILMIGPGRIVNQLYKTFTSDVKYYSWLEQKNSEAILKVLGTKDSENNSITADMNLSLGSSIATLLSMKDPIVIHADISRNDQIMLNDLQLSYKEKDLGTASVVLNQSENKLLVKIPDLSKSYVELGSYGQSFDFRMLNVKKLPEIAGKYVGEFVKNSNVSLVFEKKSDLTIGTSKVAGSKIVATYTMADALDTMAEILKKMKSDETLQQACESAGISKPDYEAMLTDLGTKLSGQSKTAKEADRIIVTCYADSKGAITGRKVDINVNGTSYAFALILSDKTIAVSFGQNGMDYLAAECAYTVNTNTAQIDGIGEAQILSNQEYRQEAGTDFTTDILSNLLDKLGLSYAQKMLFSILGIADQEAGTFEFTLGQYKGITVPNVVTAVAEEDIEQEILDFVQYDSKILPIKDRDTVEKGDYVNVDFTGLVDGKAFNNNTAADYELKAGENAVYDTFDAQLIGKKVGETVKVNVTLPETYTPDPDVAGKKAEFTVKINAIGTREYTDEFVAYNTDYKTTEEYHDYVASKLSEENKYNDQSAIDDEILEKVVANTTFSSVDQSEIDAKEKEMYETYNKAAQYYGVDMETFVDSSFGLSLEEFNEQISFYAEQYVKESYVLAEIAKVENITISDQEYEQMAKELVNQYEYDSIDQMEEQNGGHEKVAQAFLEKKVLEFLRENTTIE